MSHTDTATRAPLRSTGYVARELGVTERTVQRLTASGAIKGVRIGRVVRISDEEVERLRREGTA